MIHHVRRVFVTSGLESLQLQTTHNCKKHRLCDSAGNLVSDPLRGQTLSYNILSLPCSISTSSDEADYTYLADGTKVLVVGEQNEDGYAYLGSMVFALREGEWLFDSTPFAGGMIRRAGGSWVADRHATDHLGSVRAVVRNGQVLERNDYYPYGGRHENPSLAADAANRWRFSGKELQTTAGVNLLDFGARLYDDRLCRWTTRDPMSEKYYGFSPYNYCAGDPVSFQDPDGMDRQIKTRQNTKVISARFYVDHSKYHGINTYDAIAKAALFLNNAKGLKYSKDGETHPVSFDITVMRSFNPEKDAKGKAGANFVVIDESVDYPKDKDGNSILGHANGGKKVSIHNKQINALNTILHEMLHSMGAALQKGPDGKFIHEPNGLMVGNVQNQTQEISQQTINDIIDKGYEFTRYSNANSGNAK